MQPGLGPFTVQNSDAFRVQTETKVLDKWRCFQFPVLKEVFAEMSQTLWEPEKHIRDPRHEYASSPKKRVSFFDGARTFSRLSTLQRSFDLL